MKAFLKIFAAIFILSATVLPSKAAEPLRVQNFEGGLSFGPTFGLKPNNSYSGKIGANTALDLRYNFPNSRWDIGASVISNVVMWDRYNNDNEFLKEEFNYNTAFVVTSHYNFLQGKKLNPYIGFGFGLSDIYSNNKDRKLPSVGAIFCPTVGIELFYHVRINAGFYLSRSGFNSFALSAGFVIGGRPKKAKTNEL